MTRMFGTDGVRGLANASLSPELALRVASAAAAVLGPGGGLAVVGRDPRVSGEMLEAAVVAGLAAGGLDVLPVGVLPTPAVAYLTGTRGAVLGVMISASHNPMPDNGIKIFAAGGHKLDDEVEDQIEALFHSGALSRPVGAGVGRVRPVADAVNDYVAHLVSAVGPLGGVRVVVDCAHGAASVAAPAAFRAAGAEVIAIHAEPTGLNINDGCGSTHLGALQQAVRDHDADLGIGLDGDADRCLAVDAAGNIVDGDHIMAVLALAMRDTGTLVDNTLVTTVMSNAGLHTALRAAGITLRTTAVGDRYVLEELRAGGFNLGGEQSGHMIFPDFGTTGDGTLTGLRLMARMVETGKSLAELAAVMTTLPQVLVNVPVTDKAAAVAAPVVLDAVAEAERALADSGRVLLRPSGTEQLVRVMVEAPEQDQAQQLADDLAKVVASL